MVGKISLHIHSNDKNLYIKNNQCNVTQDISSNNNLKFNFSYNNINILKDIDILFLKSLFDKPEFKNYKLQQTHHKFMAIFSSNQNYENYDDKFNFDDDSLNKIIDKLKSRESFFKKKDSNIEIYYDINLNVQI